MNISGVVLALAVLTAGADRGSPRGAKELFYDPTGNGATLVLDSSGKPPAETAPSRKTARVAGPLEPLPSHAVSAQSPQPSAPSESRTVTGLSYWIELVGVDGGSSSQVTEHRVFRSGERIRLHFRSNSDGKIQLLQLGASGTAQVLFPDPGQGLFDERLLAHKEQVLPSPEHWFRFDDNVGKERLLVIFAAQEGELPQAPAQPALNVNETKTLLASVASWRGGKDLLVESEERPEAQPATYGVNVAGQPVVLEIVLEHR